LALAYLLDLCLGDPQGWFHPVRIIGRGVNWAEKILWQEGKRGRWWGLILWGSVILPTYFISVGIIKLISSFSSLASIIGSSIMLYWCLAVKDLALEARRVGQALAEEDIEKARQYLALIVGRDTKGLDQEGIIRAAVETVAENITDGVIAPIFYGFIGGAPLAMAYKAVNTLDSMVGYKDQRYYYFGYFSAKLDDLFNYLPARLALLLIPLACLILRKHPWNALVTGLQDGKKHPSPNAGLPEAAVAGALGLRLGGPNYYQGTLVNKPFLGHCHHPITKNNIEEAIKIMQITAFLSIVWGYFIRMIFL
jgi:adenosylcobinamide-phosphate synthase